MAVMATFGGWCLYQFFTLPPKLRNQGFESCFLLGAAFSLAGLAGWTTTVSSRPFIKRVRVALICLLPVELFWFAWSERRQADMALYFPAIPVLDKLATLPLGRIWGFGCLPPSLNQIANLDDVRGYDGVDPRDFVRLLELAVDKRNSDRFSYARTQAALPAIWSSNQGSAGLHPVANLLNVRYLIFREQPRLPFPIILHEDDYWIVENRDVLPRVFVPRSARVVKDDDEALARMTPFEFAPRATAYVTDDLQLPVDIRGTANVRYEIPSRTVLEINMQTAGLVVLCDSWNAGWRAELDGTTCPIYRVDLALRGFQVPAGKHQIVCIYDPPSVRIGFRAAAVGGFFLFLWISWAVRGRLPSRGLPGLDAHSGAGSAQSVE
jgi:hypothetical protein